MSEKSNNKTESKGTAKSSSPKSQIKEEEGIKDAMISKEEIVKVEPPAEKPDSEKEVIVTTQTEAEIQDANMKAADGILTPADNEKTNGEFEVDSNEPVQGEISQEEAINAILQNRKLRKEIAGLKARFGA